MQKKLDIEGMITVKYFLRYIFFYYLPGIMYKIFLKQVWKKHFAFLFLCSSVFSLPGIRRSSYVINFWIFSSETTEPNSTKLGWDGPWVVFLQNCFGHLCHPFKMASVTENRNFFNFLLLLCNVKMTSHFSCRYMTLSTSTYP